MISDKKSLRKEMLNKRSGLTFEQVESKSRLIIERLLRMEEFINSSVVMCYMDFRNEVRTGELIKICLSEGKRLLLPRINKESGGMGHMEAREIKDLLEDLQPGNFGVMEPRTDRSRVISPALIDLMVVPGVAFDERRYRLGYGGGYYDSFLKKTRLLCPNIALAFDLQVLREVPCEAHDVRMTAVLTESRMII